jgi:hypothetical protein
VKKYGDDAGGRQAALITYYGFRRIFPLLLLGGGVLSRVSWRGAVQIRGASSSGYLLGRRSRFVAPCRQLAMAAVLAGVGRLVRALADRRSVRPVADRTGKVRASRLSAAPAADVSQFRAAA